MSSININWFDRLVRTYNFYSINYNEMKKKTIITALLALVALTTFGQSNNIAPMEEDGMSRVYQV